MLELWSEVATVVTTSRGREFVTSLPCGVKQVWQLGDGSSGGGGGAAAERGGDACGTARAQRWLYRIGAGRAAAADGAQPVDEVPCTSLLDMLKIADVAQVQQLTPLLLLSMRVGTLYDGFISMNGFGNSESTLFPASWWDRLQDLQEATGGADSEGVFMQELQGAAFAVAKHMAGKRMETVTKFASSALELASGGWLSGGAAIDGGGLQGVAQHVRAEAAARLGVKMAGEARASAGEALPLQAAAAAVATVARELQPQVLAAGREAVRGVVECTQMGGAGMFMKFTKGGETAGPSASTPLVPGVSAATEHPSREAVTAAVHAVMAASAQEPSGGDDGGDGGAGANALVEAQVQFLLAHIDARVAAAQAEAVAAAAATAAAAAAGVPAAIGEAAAVCRDAIAAARTTTAQQLSSVQCMAAQACAPAAAELTAAEGVAVEADLTAEAAARQVHEPAY